jgi:hypothetical protein
VDSVSKLSDRAAIQKHTSTEETRNALRGFMQYQFGVNITEMKFFSTYQTISSSIASVLDDTVPLIASQCIDFSVVASLWDEYRPIRATYHFIPFNITAGLAFAAVDLDDTGVWVSINEAMTYDTSKVFLFNEQVYKGCTPISWHVEFPLPDPSTLWLTTVTQSTAFCCWKSYGDSNFKVPASTDLGIVYWEVDFQFRQRD